MKVTQEEREAMLFYCAHQHNKKTQTAQKQNRKPNQNKLAYLILAVLYD